MELKGEYLMNINMDLSDILLYLDLLKKQKRKPSFKALKKMLYYLKNSDEVKVFWNKIEDMNPPYKFTMYSLIHFIEDYEDLIHLKNKTLKKTSRKYSNLFIQQILLSKTQNEAVNIINDAKKHGVILSEFWTTKYDSMIDIKNRQNHWREGLNSIEFEKYSLEIYNDYCNLKIEYFKGLSITQLKEKLISKKENKISTLKSTPNTTYSRSVFIREFARRVSNGVCQLCDMDAPFYDTHGQPFLEVHHIHYLSNGGNDTIDNVIALCPNCHRKIHHLEIEEDVKKISERAISNMII